jgi:BirA family transcriptional regulator, biotin operon repressor / biotin---[acetyl-CoA-carboxylase] ligase
MKLNTIPMAMYNRVVSTQATAKRSKRNGLIHCAWGQTAGYGRKGDRWVSPRGRGLYMSLAVFGVYKPSIFMRNILRIVRKHIRSYKTAKNLMIQGNDIYMDSKKLAGIIAEVQGDRTIIGIGINIRQHKLTTRFAHLEPDAGESSFSNIQYFLAQDIARDILLLYS